MFRGCLGCGQGVICLEGVICLDLTTSAALLICSTCTVAVDLSVGDARIPTIRD